MIEPEHCETGYICWAGTGYDANLALCPAGKLRICKSTWSMRPAFNSQKSHDFWF